MITNLKTIFQRPELLWLLVLIIPMIIFYIKKQNDLKAKIKISSLEFLSDLKKNFWYQIRHILLVLRILAMIFLIIAIARPIKTTQKTNETTKGIDIVLSMDISASMLADDFRPNRLEAAKSVATEFINNRSDDRIGIVAFAGESFTVCPLTTDHKTAINLLNNLKIGLIADGTAIGLGLANAVARLKESKAKSKVIILLTDGVNNTGEISPLDAAQMAKKLNIRVYTIGIGKKNTTITINGQLATADVDEEVLKQIADITGGKYFRATDEKKLREIYNEIDKMEKTIFEKSGYVKTVLNVQPFLIAAFILLLIEIILRLTVYRTLP